MKENWNQPGYVTIWPKWALRRARAKSKEAWFPFFSLASISAATDNFSQGNKLGEGGFGDVYKVKQSEMWCVEEWNWKQGKLFNGEEVVVERLSSQSGQGQEEFKNEMMCLALEYCYWEHWVARRIPTSMILIHLPLAT